MGAQATDLIGKTIAAAVMEGVDERFVIRFEDGSKLTFRVAGPPTIPPAFTLGVTLTKDYTRV